MIVVSDTTPIHYLILIEEEPVLPATFGEIVVPDAVVEEMVHRNAPSRVREWIANPPEWVKVESPSKSALEGVLGLGPGESSAIAIAIERHAEAVLMDDRKGIREARKLGLTVLTTLTIIEMAANGGLLDFETALEKLANTSFRMPPEEVLEDYLHRFKDGIA